VHDQLAGIERNPWLALFPGSAFAFAEKNMKRLALTILMFTLSAVAQNPTASHALNTGEELHPFGVLAKPATFKGKKAMRIIEDPAAKESLGVALLSGSNFKNGTLEVELAAQPAAGAGEGARGFVGLVFRSAADASKFEYIYLRPTNGRADDQLRRNHSTQYASHPDHPWHRLRKEHPGVYESYVDLEPGVWTKMRIEVRGNRAELYVNNASQPCLIVKDLKLGEGEGQVGLWIGPGTEAHFANLRITSK
jgi:hypothetical protein